MTSRLQARLALLAVPALALLAPDGSSPYAPLLSAVAALAWLCTGWLGVVAVLEGVRRRPGRAGRLASTVVRKIAPAPVRALVRVAVGASLAATVLSGPAALAEDRTPTVAGSTTDYLDWPGLAPVVAAPAVPTPTAVPRTPSPAPAAEDPPATAGTARVVVRQGDSLWSIARQALGPEATDAQVATAWPRWWAVNRSVIGDTPDLIHPGDRLTAP